MIKNGSHPRRLAIGAAIQFLFRAKWFFGLAIAAILNVAAAPPAVMSDEDTDTQYIQIMNLMDRADALRASGKTDAAKAKDQEAYKALRIFSKIHPRWNTTSVQYRLNQVAAEIEGKPSASSEPTHTTSARKPKMNLEAPKTESNPAIKLLDPGSEPRKPLRLHLTAGDKQTLILSIKLNQNIDIPGLPDAAKGNMSPKIPTISMLVNTTIQSVAPNGDAAYEMVFGQPGTADEPGISPQVAAALKQSLEGLKGLTIDAVVSDRGVNKKVDLKTPPSADAQTRQMMEQTKEGMMNMSAPLPDEAVGAGAKWEVRAPIRSVGMTVDQATDFQLVSLEGDHVSSKFTQAQSAANQKMQNAALGGQVNVLQMTNNTTGTVVSDLSKLLPPQATIDSHSEINAEVTARGKTQPINIKTDANLSLEAH